MQMEARGIDNSHLQLLGNDEQGATGLSIARIALETATSIAQLKTDT
jgi:hypothetical protein